MGKCNFFDYEVREGDPSLAVIREEEKFFGFDESRQLDYSEDYLSLWYSIINDSDIDVYSKFKFGFVNKNYVRDSLGIYDKLGINLHKVNCISKKVSREYLESVGFDELLELISRVNPGEIPFSFRVQDGSKLSLYCSREDDGVSPLISFNSILLPLYGNKITACFYLYEIACTQILGVNRGMKNILNKGVVPNFIDQVAAIELDPTLETLHSLRHNDVAFLSNNLGRIFSNPNLLFALRLKSDTFVQSILEATNLANIYFEARPAAKREMLGDVGKIFDGEMFTEELLSKYESGIDAVFKDVKVFKKI